MESNEALASAAQRIANVVEWLAEVMYRDETQDNPERQQEMPRPPHLIVPVSPLTFEAAQRMVGDNVCMCEVIEPDSGQNLGWVACPESSCHRPDHAHALAMR